MMDQFEFVATLLLSLIFSVQIPGGSTDMQYISLDEWPFLQSSGVGPLTATGGNLLADHSEYFVGRYHQANFYATFSSKESNEHVFNTHFKSFDGLHFCFWIALQPVIRMEKDTRRYYIITATYPEMDSITQFTLSADAEGVPKITLETKNNYIEVYNPTYKLPQDSSYNYLCVKMNLAYLSTDERNLHEIYVNNVKLDSVKTLGDRQSEFKDDSVFIMGNTSMSLPWRFSLFVVVPNLGHCCKPEGCTDDSCFNGGTCVPLYISKPGFTCFCKPEFEGKLCQKKSSVCQPNPCKNGGTCTPIAGRKFKCICPERVSGSDCRIVEPPPYVTQKPVMGDLNLFSRFKTINPGQTAQFILVTPEIGENATFSWSLISRANESVYKTVKVMPPLNYTNDTEKFIRFPGAKSFLKSLNSFYYDIIEVKIDDEGAYYMEVLGYANKIVRHRIQKNINVDAEIRGLKLSVKSERFEAMENTDILFTVPEKLAGNHTIYMNLVAKERRAEFETVSTDDEATRNRLIDLFGYEKIPSEEFAFFVLEFTCADIGTQTFQAEIIDVADADVPLVDTVEIVCIESMEFFIVLPASTYNFENKMVTFVAIISQFMGTEPSFEWEDGRKNKFKAPLPTEENCHSCIIQVIGQDAYDEIGLTDDTNFYVWLFNQSYPEAGNYEITATSFNGGYLTYQESSNLTILEPMSEIFLFTKDRVVEVDASVAFVLLVLREGDEASYVFDFGDDLKQKNFSLLHSYRPTANTTILEVMNPVDMEKFTPHSKYIIKYNTFKSGGRYVVKINGYNKYSLVREAKLTVEAVLSVKDAHIMVSNTLVEVGDSVDIVIIARELGTSPTFQLSIGDVKERNFTEFRYAKSVTPIQKHVGLTVDQVAQLTDTGFYYGIQNWTMPKIGSVMVKLDVLNKGHRFSSSSITVEVVKSLCKPNISITNAAFRKEDIVHYHRKDNIWLGVEIVVNCSDRSFDNRKWNITIADEIFPNNQVVLPHSVDMNGKLLHIPRHALTFGVYDVKLVVTIHQEERIQAVETHGYFEIMKAVIFPTFIGGSIRSVHYKAFTEIEVSNGTNPNDDTFTYTWYCQSSLPTDPAGVCRGLTVPLKFVGNVVKFLPSKFLPTTTYKFRVNVVGKKSKDKLCFAQQTLIISRYHSVSIICTFNCYGKVNPNEKVILEAICTDCLESTLEWQVGDNDGIVSNAEEIHDMQETLRMASKKQNNENVRHQQRYKRSSQPTSKYSFVHKKRRPPNTKKPKPKPDLEPLWNRHPGAKYFTNMQVAGSFQEDTIYSSWNDKDNYFRSSSLGSPSDGECTSSKSKGGILYIEPECLKTGKSYAAKVTVPIKTDEEKPSATYEFIVNSPPESGFCIINPPEGEAMLTRFTIICNGFEDEDQPLSYQFFYNNNFGNGSIRNEDDVRPGILLKQRLQPNSEQVFIPAGDPNNNYIGLITVVVSDNFGLTTEVKLPIKVTEPKSLTKGHLLKLVNTDQSGSIQDYIKSAGDYEGALNLANCVLEVLNDNSLPVLTDFDRWEMRENILDAVAEVPHSDIGMESGVIATVEMVLRGGVYEIDPQMASKALNILSGATSDFVKTVFSTSLNKKQVFETSLSAIHAATSLMRLTAATEPFNTVLQRSNLTKKHTEMTKVNCNVSSKVWKVVNDVSDALLTKQTRAEHDFHLDTSYLALWLRKADSAHESNHEILGEEGKDAIRLPSVSSLDINGTERRQLDIKMISSPMNPFLCGESGDIVNAHTISLQIDETYKNNRNKITSKVRNPGFVEVFMKRRGIPESVASNITTEGFPFFKQANVRFHEINVPIANVTSHILIERDNPRYSVLLAWAFGCIPNIQDFQITPFVVPPSDKSSFFMNFLASELMTPEVGDYVIGLLPYTMDIVELLNRSDGHLAFDRKTENTTMFYNLTYFVSRCLYYSTEDNAWSEEGCEVGPETNMDYVHCICNHMSIFGASFLVAPNVIDLSQTMELFRTAKDNMVVISFMILLWLLYLVLLFYAVRKDSRDLGRKTTIILQDNLPTEKYPYIIQVFTGIRPDAGTTATVSIQLHGRRRISRVRQLKSQKRVVFETGGDDWFLLKTERSLGPIKALTVTHDNTGSKPDWYLSQVKILEPFTGRFWLLLVDKWISNNPHKGLLSRYVEAVPQRDLKKFAIVFRQRVVRELRERHMWFSIFQCLPRSTFTRAQRLTCAFALLMLAMLINIMFFDVVAEKDSERYQDQVITILNVYTFNYVALIVGLQSAVIAYPFGIVIVNMFSLVKTRKYDEDEVSKLLTTTKWELESLSMHSLASSSVSGTSRDSMDSNEMLQAKQMYPEQLSLCPVEEFVTSSFIDRSKNFLQENEYMAYQGSGDFALDTARPEVAFVQRLFNEDDVIQPPPMKDGLVSLPVGGYGDMPGNEAQEVQIATAETFDPSQFGLPWWFLYFSWSIAISVTLLNTFFIMLYGLTYGYEKSVDWVNSNVMSFAESNVLLDPVQVLFIIIVSTYFMDAVSARKRVVAED